MDALIAINAAARAACQAARLSLAEAYAPTKRNVAPLEQPSAGWLAGRDEAERVCGCRVRRFYSE